MHEAACNGHLDVVKLLIKSKADLNAHGSKYDNTPFDSAMENSEMEVALALIKESKFESKRCIHDACKA